MSYSIFFSYFFFHFVLFFIYSCIHLYLKAGGRFQEMYYWDSYWIIRGLLLCDMYDTARGIIENMLWLVRIYGHMPNGGRRYYIQRSQPPLLIQMAATYHSCTQDHEFIQKNLEVSFYLKECYFFLLGLL